MLLLLLALLSSTHVWASSCSGGGQTYYINLPSTLRVARDTPAGTQLTGWYEQQFPNTYNCYLDAYSFLGSAAQEFGFSDTGRTWTSGGYTHTLYQTGVPGVALAMEFSRYVSDTLCSTWSPYLGITPAGGGPAGWSGQPPYGWTGGSCGNANYSMSMTTGGKARFTLVSTGPITSGTTSAGTVMQVSAYIDASLVGAPVSLAIPATVITSGSCITPDVTVDLGVRSRVGFTGIGTRVGATDFTINVNSCPAGMTSVQYRLELAPGVTAYSASTGVVNLDSTSTAAGVGVQVTDRSNTPYNLSTMPWKSISPNYSSAGNYTIPLRAAYYQTATAVTPGDANSAIMFTMQYL
ncbi:major type 1 subunit fimbrin (pilin) [Lysobacter sp. OAE881]|uniref:fimbrial protein n=1 Tax=Lysobacter sp. OAE881 TaxID=2663813 RepID=UPI00339A6EE0